MSDPLASLRLPVSGHLGGVPAYHDMVRIADGAT